MQRSSTRPHPGGSGRGSIPALLLAVALLVAPPDPAAAQVPPDTLRADTLVAADTLLPDTTVVADTLAPGPVRAQADSASADTVFHNLPAVGAPARAGWERGVWVWEQDDILNSGAFTLAELLADVPGVIPLLTGDYGTPVGVTGFGVGGGRVRILRDGFEVVPLEGGVADLARVGLVGISRVRLERSMGELVIHLDGLEHTDGRTYSLVEAGTGDLNTNFFRGTFADPVALGGSVGAGLERVDSRGARGDEAGNVTGSWLRYQLHRGDAAGLAVDFRSMGSESAATLYASPVTRSDLTLRGRARLAQGVTAEAYWGKSTHDVEDEDAAYALEGGSRSQLGARAGLVRGPLSAGAAWRRYGGGDLPASRIDLEAGLDEPRVGGFSAALARASWPERSTRATRVRAWTRPVAGLSLFGSWESGTFGARSFPLAAAPTPDSAASEEPDSAAADPLFRVSDGTAKRAGAQWAWRDFAVSGAVLDMEVDSLLPLGIEPDRGQPALAGGSRSGWEVWGRFPTPWEPLRLEGSLQQWEEGWSYLPRRTYTAAVSFHDVYLPTGNFEWWWTIGVRGHDPTTVRQVVGEEADEEGNVVGPELAGVPFYQNWYVRMQIRIVSVRVFIGWENFAVRRNLQNYPDRLLPITRAVYGLRWTLWN
ncbi:MAG TPA: TonB-dependent receptor plug domain-containing protein [Longimicrobiales bacterium]|nr:TonB-dependent receptor plug domain-containing protein [Longimicrobiales bacterium]